MGALKHHIFRGDHGYSSRLDPDAGLVGLAVGREKMRELAAVPEGIAAATDTVNWMDAGRPPR